MSTATASASRAYGAPGSEVTLADVGRALWRSWRWIAYLTLAAFACAIAFVLLVTPRYTGEARLLLQASDTYFTRPGGERAEQAPQIDEQAVASQVQVVMSRDLARKAIQRLGLVGNEEFDPEAGSLNILQRLGVMLGLVKDPAQRPPEERVLERYYDRLLVYPVGKSRIVAIEFRSRDPELAARGANTVAELYLDLQEDAKKDLARSASTWLGSNIDGLRKRVAEAEAKVEAFRTKTGLLVGSGTTTLSAQQLSELSAQLAQARTAQSDSQSKAKLIRDLIKDGRAFDIPDVANNELIRRLMEQRVTLKAQLALELRTLLPQHPRIKELNAQLADLETQIRGAADRTVRTLENDARIAGGRVDSLVAAVETQKRIVSQANEGEVQLRALEREARIQREQLESYLGRYREASARDADYGMPPDARIVSRAIVPQIPSFPKKLPIVAIATLAVLALAIGAVVARELLAAGAPVPHAEPAYDMAERHESDAPLRGTYDPSSGRDLRFDLTHLSPPPAPIIEQAAEPPVWPAGEPIIVPAPAPRYDFVRLVARLSRRETEGGGRRVLVRSVEGEQGRDVARGLALALVERARVLLIMTDADEDMPVEDRPGLTDLVAGEAKFTEVIDRDPGSELHVVGPGTLVNEALTANPDALEVALAAFAEAYDWVVVMLAGREPETLAALIAPRVDTVVMASDLDAADPVLTDAYEAMKRAGAEDLVVARERSAPLEAAA